MRSICVCFKLQTIVPQTSHFYNGTSSGGFTTLDLVTSIGIDHMPPNGMSDVSLIMAPSVSRLFSWAHSKAHHIVGQQLAIWTCVAILSPLWGRRDRFGWVSRQISGVRTPASLPSGPPYLSLSTHWRAFLLVVVVCPVFFSLWQHWIKLSTYQPTLSLSPITIFSKNRPNPHPHTIWCFQD